MGTNVTDLATIPVHLAYFIYLPTSFIPFAKKIRGLNKETQQIVHKDGSEGLYEKLT